MTTIRQAIGGYKLNRYINQPGMMQITCLLVFSLTLLTAASSFGQSVRIGPNGEFSAQTLSLPYAFYNDSFGFAAGYAYGVVGRPQKQATLLTTAMVGSKGSAMGFLIGRDIQMPWVDRLFLDPVVSLGYIKDNEAFVDTAVSDEDFKVQMMVAQPFQF